MAEGGRDGKGFLVPELVDEWKMGCPKSPVWESGQAKLGRKTRVCLPSGISQKATWATMSCTSSGCMGPGDKISLCLQNWELAKVAPNFHMALDVRCQEINEAWLWCGYQKPAVTA